jgi:hypothetical protein
MKREQISSCDLVSLEGHTYVAVSAHPIRLVGEYSEVRAFYVSIVGFDLYEWIPLARGEYSKQSWLGSVTGRGRSSTKLLLSRK